MRCEEITIQAPESGAEAGLFLYLLDNSRELYDGLLRPMVLICPGGGYEMTSDREAEGIALKLMATGCHCAVLRYSVAPHRYPTALLQAAASIKLIREHAAEWYIDPERIYIQGSSAGGHLAASLGVFWKQPFLAGKLLTSPDMLKPNGLILSYPVITSGMFAHRGSFENLLGDDPDKQLLEKLSLEKQVTQDTPRTFLWHTFEDGTVPVENSLLFAKALREKGIPVEFHLFEKGPHGLGTASKLTMSADGRGVQKECEIWMELLRVWMGM